MANIVISWSEDLPAFSVSDSVELQEEIITILSRYSSE